MINYTKTLLTKWREAAIGIVIASTTILLLQSYDASVRLTTLPEQFFEIEYLEVSDFRVGDTARVSYLFSIREPLTVQYTTQVKKISDNENGTIYNFIHPIICQGIGTREFESPMERPALEVSANWFIHDACNITPGKYQLMTTWNIFVEGYPMKLYQKESNVFEVTQ